MDAGGTITLDCRGLLCPLPIIRVQDRVADLAPGTRLRTICTDPSALQDIPTWCRINGHAVLETGGKNHEYLVTLRIGPAR